uniref:Putative proteoglycan 4 n=1 Tax=Culex tarsalis TaxID=7177 RepID=A0A1Q3F3F9_CULTA
MNRGGEGTPPATKSGRKVKRPAHFDDSPDAASPGKRRDTTTVAPEPVSAKKTARKTLMLAGTPPSAKNGSDSEAGAAPEVKKSARKTLAKNGGSSREESPEPEVKKAAAPASARKTLLKSAVKNSSVEGGTPKKTPAKKAVVEPEQVPEAGPGLSRTGRKIKVPAHLKEFEDVVVPAVTASRKSVAPKRDELEEEDVKPVAKTPGKAKAAVVRQLATEHEDEKPAAKTPGKGKLTRKAAEEEEEDVKPVTKTPGRGRSMARKPSVDEAAVEEKPKTSGRARSVARQPEEEDKPAPKTPGKFVRKPVEEPQEEQVKPAPKTPARTKSVPRRFADAADEEEPKPAPKTPGRAKSMAARKPSVDEPAPAPKTPSRRAKSMAPQAPKPDEADPLALPEEPASKPESPVKKPPPKTPSRAKSLAREPSPEPSTKADPSEPAPTSRSGRKIKPKKYFGEFEQDESVPTVVAAATPKVVVPSSPVKTASAPSPIRSPAQQIVKKGSPYAPKKDIPATSSPVKRLAVPAQQPPPAATKKAKKDDDGEGSPFKISPATEERQITKRNVNDHHHVKPDSPKPASPVVAAPKPASPPKQASPKLPATPSDPEIVSDLDPLASSSSTNTGTAPMESSETVTPPKEEIKPKRGRKTLPAASSSEDSDLPKPAPKTPGRKTMVATSAPIAPAEEPGSSRSGRKIKPKKFFDDGEAAATKPAKSEVATPAGRGKRKTIAPPVVSEEEEEKESEQKKKKKEKDDEDDEPKVSVSREEIMAIVGDFQNAAVAPVEAEPTNGTPQENSDAPETTDEVTADEMEQPAEPITATVPDPEIPHSTQDEKVSESAGNFPDPPIEQTPPLATTTTTAADPVPDDPAPSAEGGPPPAAAEESATVEMAEASASSAFSEALLVEEEPQQKPGAPTVEDKMEEMFESVEFLEESSARLSDVTAAVAAVADGVPAQLLEQELGGEADGVEQEKEVVPEEEKPEPAVVEPVEEAAVQQQPEPDQTDDLDNTEAPSGMEEPTLESVAPEEEEVEELNKTEPPTSLNDTAEDVAQNEEEDLLATSMPESVDEYFAENDRDQESITIFPEIPKEKQPTLEQEELDLVGKLPEPQQSSSNTVAFVEIPETPVVTAVKQQPTPATPKTPESKPIIAKDDDYSPDKPDAQEQASVPQQAPEIIEIFDSPVVVGTALEPVEKQATSTPVGKSTAAAGKLTIMERLAANNRKRSLSASDADLSTKKNVTFHSPANSTILVDTLDERLKKSLKVDSKSKNARKRSLSEHKELALAAGSADGPKPSKISKLPNFKNIHQNQFSRMESIAEYHNRKVQRAKEILTNSASKSPAVARSATPTKSAPQSSHRNGAGVATQLKFSAAKPASSQSGAVATSSSSAAAAAKLLSDEARQEKRQQQFKAAFKPKSGSEDAGKSSQDTPDGARRVVEQSRHKQHQILKGVRTNKRFELLMKFRDAAQD